jgi:hypothetical protein
MIHLSLIARKKMVFNCTKKKKKAKIPLANRFKLFEIRGN